MRVPPLAAATIAAIIAAGVAACTSLLDPIEGELAIGEPALVPGQTVRRVATIGFYGDPIVVGLPATARAGAPTTVTVAGRVAEVGPYQRVCTPRPNEGCTRELRITERRVSVTFAALGAATVRVTGRVQPGDSLVTVTRQLRVE